LHETATAQSPARPRIWRPASEGRAVAEWQSDLI
jgi:hypothetical protein